MSHFETSAKLWDKTKFLAQYALKPAMVGAVAPSSKALAKEMVAHMGIERAQAEPVATAMVVVCTYWLSYEYVRDPRRALEPESAQLALLRGAHHVLNLLVPYLETGQRMHLLGLVGAYQNPAP